MFFLPPLLLLFHPPCPLPAQRLPWLKPALRNASAISSLELCEHLNDCFSLPGKPAFRGLSLIPEPRRVWPFQRIYLSFQNPDVCGHFKGFQSRADRGRLRAQSSPRGGPGRAAPGRAPGPRAGGPDASLPAPLWKVTGPTHKC